MADASDRVLVAALIALTLTACSTNSSPPAGRAAPGPTPTPAPINVLAHGCGETPILNGGRPLWLDDAGAHNNPVGVPYAIAKPAIAAGFLFGYPLTSGRTDPSNKILWVVGRPRNGSVLAISAHPVGSATPIITVSINPNAGPGEIYPSIVDVPHSGCWYFDLKWDGNEAALDLDYA